MGILALIAEFENDIRRERQLDGIAKAKERGTRFGPKPQLTTERINEIRKLRHDGSTVPEIMRQTIVEQVERLSGSRLATLYITANQAPTRGLFL